jgi:hypothetical protein
MDRKKRVVTSAIDGMSVAEVRRGLDYMRKRWREHSLEEPFYLSEVLFNGMQIQQFAFMFVMGHHHKRHNKSRRDQEEEVKAIEASEAAKEDEEDEEDEEDDEDGEDEAFEEKVPVPVLKRARTRSFYRNHPLDDEDAQSKRTDAA